MLNSGSSSKLCRSTCNCEWEHLAEVDGVTTFHRAVLLKFIQVTYSEEYKDLNEWNCHISFYFKTLPNTPDVMAEDLPANKYFQDGKLPCIIDTYHPDTQSTKYFDFGCMKSTYTNIAKCPAVLQHLALNPNSSLQIEVRFRRYCMIINDRPFLLYLQKQQNDLCDGISDNSLPHAKVYTPDGVILGVVQPPSECYTHRPASQLPKCKFEKPKANPYIEMEKKRREKSSSSDELSSCIQQ